MTTWHLYLIRTKQNSLYTGITTDVSQRLAEHQAGRGAKYLRSKGPLRLVYQTPIGDRAIASKAEHRLKKLKKAKKEQIVADSPSQQTLLKLLNIEPSE